MCLPVTKSAANLDPLKSLHMMSDKTNKSQAAYLSNECCKLSLSIISFSIFSLAGFFLRCLSGAAKGMFTKNRIIAIFNYRRADDLEGCSALSNSLILQ